MDLVEFLYTALLYQAMTNRNINAATLLEQYSVLDLVEKKTMGPRISLASQTAFICGGARD